MHIPARRAAADAKRAPELSDATIWLAPLARKSASALARVHPHAI
jgi:hypothetical protein